MQSLASLRNPSRPGSPQPELGVRVEDVAPIRRLILDRPSRKNALTIPMYRTLTSSLSEAAGSDRIDVVLLSSSAWPFSVGNDFHDMLEGSVGPADGDEFAAAAGAFLRTLASFPKPIVAAVGGLAVGAGATILLLCDVVIAATTAAFEFPSTKLGVLPDAGSSVLLAARVGLQRATEWFFFGDRVDVATAQRLGLVNAVVSREELASTALARAEALATLPRGTVLETKRLLRAPLQPALDEAITREMEAIATALRTP